MASLKSASVVETPDAPKEPVKKELVLSDPPVFDTGYLKPAHATITLFWDGRDDYWKLSMPVARARLLRELLGPFNPKDPPKITPTEVLSCLAKAYAS